MKLKRNRRFSAEVTTASLNDIMFFLLLFFLIISTVANPSIIKVMLPKSSSAQALSKKQVTLTVNAEKQYFVDNIAVAPDKLENTLKQSVANISDPTVVLRLDESLTVQDLVDVMQIGAKNKIKMVLATKR
ncbi:MAG: biopolymer transporter ExbD [Sphingobacteriales bacterium]|nr:biopolymer transporter ExbD [Sphingobacteriales bacterium]